MQEAKFKKNFLFNFNESEINVGLIMFNVSYIYCI